MTLSELPSFDSDDWSLYGLYSTEISLNDNASLLSLDSKDKNFWCLDAADTPRMYQACETNSAWLNHDIYTVTSGQAPTTFTTSFTSTHTHQDTPVAMESLNIMSHPLTSDSPSEICAESPHAHSTLSDERAPSLDQDPTLLSNTVLSNSSWGYHSWTECLHQHGINTTEDLAAPPNSSTSNSPSEEARRPLSSSSRQVGGGHFTSAFTKVCESCGKIFQKRHLFK